MYTEEQKRKLLDDKISTNVVRRYSREKLDRKELISLFWSVAKNIRGRQPYTDAIHAVIDRIEQKGFGR